MKLIRRSSTSHATSEVKELDEGVWLPADLQPLVEYRHVQNIGSAYAGYGFKYGKWSLNPGIRMEHTWQDVTYKQGEGKDFNYRVRIGFLLGPPLSAWTTGICFAWLTTYVYVARISAI